MEKKFRLSSAEIKQIAPGLGSCIASDMITVGGQRVGYMYREPPDNSSDSGWRFLSGEETREYVDDAGNFALYDVNTIANYDPGIVPYLDAIVFSAYRRDAETLNFEAVPFNG